MTVRDRNRFLVAFLIAGQALGCAAGFAENPSSIPVGRVDLERPRAKARIIEVQAALVLQEVDTVTISPGVG
jgi:hypothetical protein